MTFNAFFDVLEKLGSASTSHYVSKGDLTSGNSNQSDILSAGKMIVFAPALRAATVFSRNPPMRRTLPVTVNSPVMAIVGSKGLSKASDNRALAIVIPADGPISLQSTVLEEFRLSQSLTIFLNSAFRAVKMDLSFLEELIFREHSRHY